MASLGFTWPHGPQCPSISFSPGAETWLLLLLWINDKIQRPVPSEECPPRFRADVEETAWDLYFSLNCNQSHHCSRVVEVRRRPSNVHFDKMTGPQLIIDLFKKEQATVSVGCESNPCINGGGCKEMKDKSGKVTGYRCECPCGYCGKNCEKGRCATIANCISIDF